MIALLYISLAALGCVCLAALVLMTDRLAAKLLVLLQKQIRPRLRKYRNWERTSLLLLAASLLSVLILSWIGAATHPDPEHPVSWFFRGITVTFDVFECNSEDFLGYAEHFNWVHCILSCAVPLLTVSTALSLLWEHLPHHVPIGCRVWHIFSEPDGNSIRMAKKLSRDDQLCIFLRTRRSRLDEDVLTELQDINHFLYPKDELRFLRWKSRRSRTLRFYFLSENTDENFRRMEELLNAVPEKKLFQPVGTWKDDVFQQELYLLSETESAPLLIEHLRKKLKESSSFRNTELRLLDRYRAISYDLLRRKPLYRHVSETPGGDRLNILVLGFGKIGREFFRAACSLGVLHDCRTEFTLCDQDIHTKLSRFLSQCSELDRSVCFRARTLDAETACLERLAFTQDFHYILVALGDDERNIRVATRLTRHYRLRRWESGAQKKEARQPQICVNIEDTIKHGYVRDLWKESLHIFGGLDQVFTEEVLMPRDLWKAARYIHGKLTSPKYGGDPQHWGEYERRSSMACAAHAPCYLKVPGYDRTAESWCSYNDRCSALTDTEHRRWMAFVRSEGLRLIPTGLLTAAYFDENRSHVDIPAKLTPCLVESRDELNAVWGYLTEHRPGLCEDKLPFRERDEFVVRHAECIASLIPPPKDNTHA